jgi:class 3 adenylate cyclase
VLFVDVKGSMDLTEQLDAEEWHAILDRFFQILTDGMHRFEGSVNQYTGDGMMALFGAPIAHEDHPRRACWAALHLQGAVRAYADELRRTQGLSFSTRMGINSGDVVIGRIGDDLRTDYTAQGHTVGLAQRMEQLAEPGTICLTMHTRRLVEGYFRLRDLGPVAIKGASAPLEVAVLEGVGQMHTRLDVSRARGFSRFVGRAHEMEGLQGALATALDGAGQIAGVVGDAGVGKSRLCHEFLECCRARGIPVWRAHCPSHGRAIPLLPILQLTRSFSGIDAQDSPAEARRKIAGTLALLDDALVADLPVAFDFLQVPDPAHPLPQMPRHVEIGPPFGAQQDDLRAQGQCLRRLRAMCPAARSLALLRRDHQLCFRPSSLHPRLLDIRDKGRPSIIQLISNSGHLRTAALSSRSTR